MIEFRYIQFQLERGITELPFDARYCPFLFPKNSGWRVVWGNEEGGKKLGGLEIVILQET